MIGPRRGHLVLGMAAVSLIAGCTNSVEVPMSGSGPTGEPTTTSTSSNTSTTRAGQADEEQDGVVKAGPTVRLRETDEFGLVVRAERRDTVVRVTVDRVDSLTGEEADKAAAADGRDVSNDHYEVNDNPKTREYVLANDPDIWQANDSNVSSPKPLTVEQWLAFVQSDRGREAMFHFDVEDGRVVGVEQQYFP